MNSHNNSTMLILFSMFSKVRTISHRVSKYPRSNRWQRDGRVRSQIQVLLQGLFLKTSHCFQRRITPNVLPTWCHFLSDSDDACAPTLLGGSRVITQTLRMSMKIQFRGVWGRIRGSNHNRPFYNFDF